MQQAQETFRPGQRYLVHFKGRTRLAKVERVYTDGSGDVRVKFHRTQAVGFACDLVRIPGDMLESPVFGHCEQRDLFADVADAA